mmetsp:Transcript_17260/g.37304  ORF Transcript_17260/g.37304 Transcript_17260/m.37304 type:complete len:117 (-) Transcript_17260:76-426(-)
MKFSAIVIEHGKLPDSMSPGRSSTSPSSSPAADKAIARGPEAQGSRQCCQGCKVRWLPLRCGTRVHKKAVNAPGVDAADAPKGRQASLIDGLLGERFKKPKDAPITHHTRARTHTP